MAYERGEASVEGRIKKDIDLFYKNIQGVKSENGKMDRVIKLSRMYANDSKSYLDKGDFYTAFSCISYAHGLLDAVREITEVTG